MKQATNLIAGFCAGIGVLLSTQCTQPAPEKVIVKPQILAVNNQVLEIDSIVRTDSNTVFHMQAFFRPNYWIKIDPQTFLTDNLGRTYSVQKSAGIPLGEKFWMPESGQTTFQLVFPPLQAKATSVDFSEGKYKTAWALWGIQLTNEKKLQVELPADFQEARVDPNASLPDPVYQYGMATLKGQILHYRPGMEGEFTAYFMGILQGQREGNVPLKVTDDGCFELQVPSVAPFYCHLFCPFGRIECMLAPNETTQIYINPTEYARRQSKLRREEPAIGKLVYYAGYLAGLQQEMADHDSLNFSFVSNNEEYLKVMEQIEGMKPEEFQAYLLRRMDEKKQQIERCPCSQAFKEQAHIKLCQSIASAMSRTESLLKEAHIQKHQLNSKESRDYYKNTRIRLPKSYFDCLKEMPLLFSPHACYSSVMGDWISYLTYQPELRGLVSQHEEMAQLLKAEEILAGIHHFITLTDKQLAELKALPEPYRLFLEAANQQLMDKIEANKRKVGANIHEIEKVKKEELFPAILSKFRGHTLLIDFWATWCGPCNMGHKEMAPLKEEWKNKDIVYIYIAGENSPEEAWKNKIPDIPGEHFRITQSQWDYLSGELGVSGVPTYIIVDKNGNMVHKVVGFPGVDEMKNQLQKAMNVK
ncbi:protein containing Redoxin domain protein [gut metagenome]|uniref:Protein containing Redoxin domain protein n=1 Tax=gut metagenome TaxID=749906 RepID=J9FX86_9ZZZZ